VAEDELGSEKRTRGDRNTMERCPDIMGQFRNRCRRGNRRRWGCRHRVACDVSILERTIVGEFLKKFNFDLSICRGCACGLVTRYSPRPVKPLTKPWRCSSNNPNMLTHFNEKCGGDRIHGECQGGDYIASEDYTPAVIDAIHMGSQLCCSSPSISMSASSEGRVYLYPKGNFSSDHVAPCWYRF
jgi:ssDNA-binding Zn-finger/Zn-ribbon topoisomerase 1